MNFFVSIGAHIFKKITQTKDIFNKDILLVPIISITLYCIIAGGIYIACESRECNILC